MELDPLRAYTDDELRLILGGISKTTLWEIRDNPARGQRLKSGYLYVGSRARRTTARQIQEYLDYLSSAEADGSDQFDEARLDELGARRARLRQLA